MVIKSLTHSVYKMSGKIPLRVILVVPFIIQVVGAVGLVGYLSFKNGQKSVNDLAARLTSETSARIQQHVMSYLDKPHQTLQIISMGIESGDINPDNFTNFGKYFWQIVKNHNQDSYIYWSNPQGYFLGVEKLENGTITLKVRDEKNEPKRETYLLDSEGSPTKLLSNTPYDPRDRPWYQAAIEAGKETWSPIFPFSSRQNTILGLTPVKPMYYQTGELRGILAINISLVQITQFLEHLKISASGESFIIEPSGDLIASSTISHPFVIKETGKKREIERLKAVNSNSIVVRQTAEHLNKLFGDFSQINQPKHLKLKINNQQQFVQVLPLEDNRGINWLIVVVVPEADFMEQINANTRTSILLCLIALGVATIVGILTSHWVLHPILKLKKAAIALSGGEFPQIVDLERSDELGVLAKTFNQMAEQLQGSFQTLESKNAELQNLNKLKDEFLANTSHELRTPLNGIIGLAESLIDGATGELPEKTKANLAMIVSSGKRLSNLVNDILDFAKLKHKTIELQIQPVGMREITDVVLFLSQPLVGKKSLQLINTIASDLPLVDADENRLQQILYNLIGNGIKFTESGLIEVSAEVVNPDSISPNSFLAITVSDTGIGMAEDKFERIFESFEQGDGSTSRIYGGTGLGLAVTKRLVELHGGKIWVESQKDQGSIFTFTLPISQNQEATKIPKKLEKEPQVIPNNVVLEILESPLLVPTEFINKNGQFKILIVDDELINLQVLANTLALENYAITQANNGLEALELIENGFHPDLILLDVMMPRMTGYEVSQKLREKFLPSELPIVMLTAKNQVDDLVEGFSAGANDYLTKPFSKNELLARIKTHIKLAKINEAYGRFVPHEFLKYLGYESVLDVKLGDQVQKEMTIMFSDIRSFTTLSEEMSPDDNFKFLNSYLSRVSPLIRDHHGFIDKYIGDAIMALFPHSPDDAVNSAIAMQKEVNLYNEHRANRGYVPISIGIGLHKGTLMLGTIGETARMESTVIADAVNLASRLEGLTKVYGVGVLISHQTLCGLEYLEEHNFRFLDRVIVKGKRKAIAVFEVYDGDLEAQKQLKKQTQSRFEVAVFLYYQQQFDESQKMFQEVLQVNPHDRAALLYVKRCEKYQKIGVPDGWDAIEILEEK
jgi:signal transduction histidine kinase/class 3 adenylate cyclase/CheY-like chemotaxis protein